MSGIFILGHGLPSDDTRPEFRKATKNMMWVQTALENALAGRRDALGDRLGLVLGSSHDELDVTMQFLKTLADTGMARPILFQNSLHNSTTGFAALSLRITGPLFTVSDRSFSGEDALSTAMQLLDAGLCDHCLVAGVESRVPALETGSSPETGEGAGAVLLSNSAGLRATGFAPLAEMTQVRCHRVPRSPVEVPAGYHESNSIEILSRALQDASMKSLRLTKPNGWWSEIEWRPL